MQFLDCMVIGYLILEERANRVAIPFHIPSSNVWVSHILASTWYFYFSHSDMCIMIFHCNFNIWFANICSLFYYSFHRPIIENFLVLIKSNLSFFSFYGFFFCVKTKNSLPSSWRYPLMFLPKGFIVYILHLNLWSFVVLYFTFKFILNKFLYKIWSFSTMDFNCFGNWKSYHFPIVVVFFIGFVPFLKN